MEHKLTCIICPNGCELIYDDEKDKVSGNLCPRGEMFAKQEILDPHRMVTALVKTKFSSTPVVSVRLNQKIKKKDIAKVMKAIDKMIINKKMKMGEVIIKDVADLKGIDVILTKDVE